jgi:hypothetical protein
VGSPEAAQPLVRQGLDADRQARHAGTSEPRHPLDLDDTGVQLEGHLLGLTRECAPERLEKPLDGARIEERRRAAAEVDRRQRAPLELRGELAAQDLELPDHPVRVLSLDRRIEPTDRLDREVTVGADPLTEGHVNVDAEIGGLADRAHPAYPRSPRLTPRGRAPLNAGGSAAHPHVGRDG